MLNEFGTDNLKFSYFYFIKFYAKNLLRDI